jgi:thiol-disulfide isomerase/thioredoxin
MMTKARNAAIFAALAVLIGFAVYQNMAGAKKAPAAAAGEQSGKANYAAPSFQLSSLDGGSYQVGGARDKPLVVNFWATWCPPCQEEAPDLQALYDKYKDRIDFYGVNLTQSDKLADVRQFVQNNGLTFPILLDKDGAVAEQYKFVFIPTSYLIDRSGTVRETVNVLTAAEWEKKLSALLKSK